MKKSYTCPECGQVWDLNGSVDKMADVWCDSCLERMKLLNTPSFYGAVNTQKADFCMDYIVSNSSTVKKAQEVWDAIKNIHPTTLNDEYKLNGFLYREHRGSLCDSMDTVQYFGSFGDLQKHVWGLLGMTGVEQVTIQDFVCDTRIGWHACLVLVNNCPVGFVNKKVERETS